MTNKTRDIRLILSFDNIEHGFVCFSRVFLPFDYIYPWINTKTKIMTFISAFLAFYILLSCNLLFWRRCPVTFSFFFRQGDGVIGCFG